MNQINNNPEELEVNGAYSNMPAAATKIINIDVKPASEESVKGFKVSGELKSKSKDVVEMKDDRVPSKEEPKAEEPKSEYTDFEEETSETVKVIPTNLDLRFKSSDNNRITLVVYIKNYGRDFHVYVMVDNIMKVGELPLDRDWFTKETKMKKLAKEISKLVKPHKIMTHVDGLIAEIEEFVKMVLIPVLPDRNVDTSVNFANVKGSIVKYALNKDNEMKETVLTNFTFDIDTLIEDIDNDLVTYKGVVICDNESKEIIITSELISDNNKFRKAINDTGLKVEFNPKNISDIIQAFQRFVSENINLKQIKKTSQIGWHEENIRNDELYDYYLMPSTIIDNTGIHKNDKFLVEFPEELVSAKHLDITEISNDEFNKCGNHIVSELMKLHDPYYVRASLSTAFGAPFLRDIAKHYDECRGVFNPTGRPQIGKSLFCKLMQNFYGFFPYDAKSYVTFGSTVNNAVKELSYFIDVFALGDDVTGEHLANPKFMEQMSNLIHNYVGSTGRGRLGSIGSDNPILGSLAITSEGKIAITEGNASRTLAVLVPAVDKEKSVLIQEKCLENRHFYNGFMGRYIAWNINHSIVYKEKLTEYKKLFYDEFKKIHGVDPTRFANMYAILYMEFERFCIFMTEHGFMTKDYSERELNEFKEQIFKNGKETASLLYDRDPANSVINHTKDLISSGQVIVIDKKDTLPEDRNKAVIGRIENNTLYINPGVTIVEVHKRLKTLGINMPLDSSSLIAIFNERGMLVEKNKGENLKSMRIGGQVIKCWAFDKKLFGYESESTVDIKMSIPMSILSAINKSGINEKPTLSATQYESIKIDIYEDLHFKESDIEKYADMIDVSLSSFYLAKGWSKVITTS